MIKNKLSTFKLQLVFASFIILLLSGCKVTQGVSSLMSKKVKPQYYTFEDKSIVFTPLVHFGKKEFYAGLKDSIVNWKKDGYTIFYEQVVGGQVLLGMDSISFDELRRKYRRISGGEAGSPEEYAEELQKVFKNAIAQPSYMELGIDSTDINADITFLDLVNKIEELYGEIKLDSCDYATHIDSTYNCTKGLKIKKLDPVYVDYRNTVIVDSIINSDHKKIVVLFGAAHKKGVKKLLKGTEATTTN